MTSSPSDVITTTLTPVAIGLVGSVVHGLIRRAAGREALPAATLWWLISLIISSGSVVASFWIDPNFFAQQIGYARTPFEFEVSGANLGAFVTLLVSLRVRSWRLPVVTFYGIFLWLAAGGHIYQYYKHDNHNTGNGPAIWISDVVIPFVAFVLLLITSRRPAGESRQADDDSHERSTHATR